jgi:predicted metal-dependent peptidase
VAKKRKTPPANQPAPSDNLDTLSQEELDAIYKELQEKYQPCTPEERMLAAERVQAARVLGVQTWPYLATAVCRMTMWPTENVQMDRLGVSKNWVCYYNVRWAATVPLEELTSCITLHETFHLLNNHFQRAPVDGNQQLENICQDLAINCGMRRSIEMGVRFREAAKKMKIEFKVPQNAVYPDVVDDVMTPEGPRQNVVKALGGPFPCDLLYEEYREMIKPPKPQSRSGGGEGEEGSESQGKSQGQRFRHGPNCGSGAHGVPQPYEDPEAEALGKKRMPREEQELVKRQTAEAIRDFIAKHPGMVAGDWLTFMENQLVPAKVPWQQILKSELRKRLRVMAGRTDRTYSRRNRRQPASWKRAGRTNFIWAGFQSHVPEFLCVIDTSGSMGASDYNSVFSEIQALSRMDGRKGVPTLCCDTQAHTVKLIRDASRVQVEGGGGTDMGVGIAAGYDLGYRLLVVMTDGFTPWPTEIPADLQVIVCLTQQPSEDYNPPDWAKVVYCGDDVKNGD